MTRYGSRPDRSESRWSCILATVVVLALVVQVSGLEATSIEPIGELDPTGLEPSVAEQLGAVRELLLAEAEAPDVPAADRAAAYGSLGKQYHAYGLSDAATACYRNARTLSPGEMKWHYYLGRILQEDGDLEAARKELEESLGVGAEYLPALYSLAEIEIELNRLEVAERYLEKILREFPNSASALALEGQIALSRQDWEPAVAALEAALAEIPAADRLHYSLGLAYRGLGDLDKAREHMALRGPVGVRPPDPLMDELQTLAGGEAVHLLRGRQAYRLGRYPEAAEAFGAAVEASPESGRARVDLGAALGAMGETQAAVAELQTAIELNPESSEAHYNLGVLLARQGQPDAAVSHLRRAAELNPKDVAIRVELAHTLRRYDRFDLALPFYQSALQVDPDSQEARVGLAECLVRLGRYGEAVGHLEEAYRLEPSNGQVTHALARFLAGSPELALRDGARALELATLVFRASPTGYHAETVAMALAETGRCSEAANWQRQVLTATEPQGDSSRTEELRSALAIYENGPPCRLNAAGGSDPARKTKER